LTKQWRCVKKRTIIAKFQRNYKINGPIYFVSNVNLKIGGAKLNLVIIRKIICQMVSDKLGGNKCPTTKPLLILSECENIVLPARELLMEKEKDLEEF